jgi:hypothetical protein
MYSSTETLIRLWCKYQTYGPMPWMSAVILSKLSIFYIWDLYGHIHVSKANY